MSTLGISSRRRLTKIVLYPVLLILGCIVIVPFYLILINSLKTAGEAANVNLSFPQAFQLKNYLYVIVKGQLLRSLVNGILITSIAVTVIVLLCSVASFIIVRNPSRLNRVIYSVIIAGLIAPLSYVPEIKILQIFGIMNAYAGVIVVLVACSIAFITLMYTGFIKGVPKEIDEAAIIDGCGPLQLFYIVVFPLLKPIVFTNVIISFMTVWNDFQIILYFAKPRMYTMPMAVYQFMGYHTADYNLVCAVLVLTMLPVLVIFLFAQKYIISGMTTGAVKG